MKWAAQVAHVAMKDVRWSRWLILAYVAMVGLTTALALELLGPRSVGFLWPLLLLVVGMVVFAVTIQADSPARADAFWATRPLYPSAVFAAKLLFAAVVLLGFALVGQLVALLAHDVGARQLPVMVGASVLDYAVYLAMAGVLAALTRDLRTFLLVLILFTVFMNVGWGLIHELVGGGSEPARSASPLMRAGILGGMVLLIAHQYRTRDVRRGIWLALLFALLSGVVSLRPAAGRAAEFARDANVPADLQTGQLGIEQVTIHQNADGGSTVQLMVRLEGGSQHHRHALVGSAVHLYGRNGRLHSVVRGVDAPLGQPDMRPRADLRWLGPPVLSGPFFTGMSVELSASQTQALARPGAHLTLQGRIEVQEPRVLGAVPLARGASIASDGVRLRLINARNTPAGPQLEVRRSWVSAPGSAGSTGNPHALTRRAWSYVLVNTRRGEAMQLVEGSSSDTGLGLVMTGFEVSTMLLQLRSAAYFETSDTPVDDDWLRDARLQLVHWVPLGSYSFESAAANAPAISSDNVMRGAMNAFR